MKIRNLAFCGVMASILGVSGAYATDATIIASKAYVDARDNTKQDTANIVTTEWANTDANIKSSDARYPSMKTLQTAVGAGTSALDGQNADSETGLTAGTVDANKAGMPVVKVTETDGIVTAELGEIDTAGIKNSAVTAAKLATNAVEESKIKNGAVTAAKLATDAVETDKIKNGAVTTDKIADSSVTMPKTDFIVKQGNSTKAWNAASEESDNEAEKALAKAAKRGEEDKYVPTLSAVESRITAAVGAGTSALDYTIASGDHVDGRPVVAVTETDGIIAVTEGQITNAGVADNAAITTNKMGAITGYTISTATGAARNLAATDTLNEALGKLEKKADDNATTVDGLDVTDTATNQAVTAVNQTDGKISVTRSKITFDDGLKSALSEINATGGDYSSNCKKDNPCVLTYFDGKYEWTTMDTDNLDGVL